MSHAPGGSSCPSCAAPTPRDSRFCSSCGARLDAGATLELRADGVVPDPRVAADSPADARPSVHKVHRRPAGIHPLPLLGGSAGVAVIVSIALLAIGSVAGGLVFLALAVALLMLFSGGVRREPDARAAQLTLRAADRSRSLARLSIVSARTWVHAGTDLLRIRYRQHRVRRELQSQLAPLGEAVHRDDEQRAQALKRQAADLERQLEQIRREATAVVVAARAEIRPERLASQPTEALSLAEHTSAGAGASHLDR